MTSLAVAIYLSDMCKLTVMNVKGYILTISRTCQTSCTSGFRNPFFYHLAQ